MVVSPRDAGVGAKSSRGDTESQTPRRHCHRSLKKGRRTEKAAFGAFRHHVGNGRQRHRKRRSLKGRKVAPKYRSRKDPKLTWAGRGATPRWMRQEMKGGKLKKEAFLIK